MFYTVFTTYTETQFILHLEHVSVWTSHILGLGGHLWPVASALDSAGLEFILNTALGGH